MTSESNHLARCCLLALSQVANELLGRPRCHLSFVGSKKRAQLGPAWGRSAWPSGRSLDDSVIAAERNSISSSGERREEAKSCARLAHL